MAVNVFSQPVSYFIKLPLQQCLPVVGVELAIGVPYLGSRQVADGIGWKVTETAMGPVDILQNPVCV